MRNPVTTRAGTPSCRATSATSVAYCSGVAERLCPRIEATTLAKLVPPELTRDGAVAGGATEAAGVTVGVLEGRLAVGALRGVDERFGASSRKRFGDFFVAGADF